MTADVNSYVRRMLRYSFLLLLFPRTLYQMKKRSKRLEFGENEYVDVKQVALNSG